jgi:uncharacterized protein (TIGR03435 family)
MPPKQMFQPIAGSTGWIQSEHFTIDAKVDKPEPVEMMRGPMMQAVLEERFALKIHRVKKEVRGYQLVVGKGGAKLQATKPGRCVALDPEKGGPAGRGPVCGGVTAAKGGGVDLNGITMPGLCLYLSLGLDRDVVDKTGLAGAFDLHLNLSHADLGLRGPDSSAGEGSVPAALRKAGLDLQPARMEIDSLVIDHAERPKGN